MTWTAQEIIAKRKELWSRHKSIDQDRAFIEAVADHLTSPAGAELQQQVFNEPRLLIEMVFVVVDKEMNLIPFFLNDVQRSFSNDLYEAEERFREGKLLNLKFMILKGRQQGFTAYITAEQLARSILQKNFSGFTVADCGDNTTSIFEDKAKFTYSHIPDKLKPTEKYNNRRELHFEKINSKWRIATASKDIGRSKTVNFLHCSEAAFYEVPISRIQAAIGDALTKNAIQIYETTANGYNEYKDIWDSGVCINKFYEWWLTKEYRLNFESQEKEDWFMDQVMESKDWIWTRCRWLLNVIGLDWNQLYWYYNKWNNYKDKEMIKQEFPCTSDEAYLSSGRCVFDKQKIIEQKEYLKRLYAKQPPKRGIFLFEWNNPDTQDFIKDETIRFVERPDGPVTIYEDVKEGFPYVVGGDTKGEGTDFYAGTVINNVSGFRSATIRMQITNSKPYTYQMYCLGRYFNTALIGIEMNFNTAPIEELTRLKYPFQYTRQKYDSISKTFEQKFGWKTDGNTRPLIIDKEIDLIENNIELFTDIVMLDEALTFVYDENGRPDAEKGKHDDMLLSDMVANEIRSQQRFVVKIKVEDNKTEIQKHKERLIKGKSMVKRRLS